MLSHTQPQTARKSRGAAEDWAAARRGSRPWLATEKTRLGGSRGEALGPWGRALVIDGTIDGPGKWTPSKPVGPIYFNQTHLKRTPMLVAGSSFQGSEQSCGKDKQCGCRTGGTACWALKDRNKATQRVSRTCTLQARSPDYGKGHPVQTIANNAAANRWKRVDCANSPCLPMHPNHYL